jgi:hypothetical protein
MSISLINVLGGGGCYWGLTDRSPGYSMAIPCDTKFKIALEGSKSNTFVSGVCKKHSFIITDGEYKDMAFPSANKAVSHVRRDEHTKDSNAHLYVSFFINGKWVLADSLRREETLRCDEVEEVAVQIVISALCESSKTNKANIGHASDYNRIVGLIKSKPEFIIEARKRVNAKNHLSDI